MLFAGFFVASANIPYWLKEFEYLSVIKYGYQSLMHNQFDYYWVDQTASFTKCEQASSSDCVITYPCMVDPTDPCDPFSQLSNQGLWSSIACLFGIYVGCYLISWMILIRLSKDYSN